MGDGGVRTSFFFLSEYVVCERNRDPSRTKTPQGVFVCDRAGLVLNKISLIFQVGIPGVRYRFVNGGPEKCPGAPNWSTQQE